MTAQEALRDVTAQAQADQANLDQTQLSLSRQTTLYQADAGSRLDFEAAVKAYKAATALMISVKAQTAQAQIAVKTAKVNLSYTNILAPISGTVLLIVTKEGQTVNAAQSAPTIVTLGQLNRMTIEAEIAEADVINVRQGQAVSFTILGDPDHHYRAKLRRIDPAPTTFSALDTTTNTSTAVYYNGLFDVDNPDLRLKTAMTANVNIITATARHVLSVPSIAVTAKGQKQSVKVIGDDKKVIGKTITTGLDDGTRIEVISGLSQGERVVLAEGLAATAPKTSNGTLGGGSGRVRGM